MKKLKKNQLRLDKEVITSLSGNQLSFIKGGGIIMTREPGCEVPKVTQGRVSDCWCPATNNGDSCPCVQSGKNADTVMIMSCGVDKSCPCVYTEQENCQSVPPIVIG